MPDLKVLVIENVDADRERVVNALRDEGFKLLHAATKENARVLADRELPSLVIADIELVEDSGDHFGIDAAIEIQKRTHCGVIYLTGQPGLPQVAMSKILKTINADFIKKPFEKADLLSAINNSLMRVTGEKVIFISYHHNDSEIVKEMLRFLEPLEKVGISPWLDSQIEFGTEWREEIIRNLGISVAAIMICSQDFANSKFISEVELPAILENFRRGQSNRVYTVFYKPAVRGDIKDLLPFQGVGSYNNTISRWSRERREKQCWIPLREDIERALGPGKSK